MNDIEITKKFKMKTINKICKKVNIKDFVQYGEYKAKINNDIPKLISFVLGFSSSFFRYGGYSLSAVS